MASFTPLNTPSQGPLFVYIDAGLGGVDGGRCLTLRLSPAVIGRSRGSVGQLQSDQGHSLVETVSTLRVFRRGSSIAQSH